MKVSQQVLEWQAEAEIKAKQAFLIRALAKHCNGPVPEDLVAAIEAVQDIDVLARWFDTVFGIASFDEFRQAIEIPR